MWRLDPRKGKLVLRLQASVFTSVNWDEPRAPCRTKPHKGLDINSQGARYGWLLCRHNPDRSCYSFLFPPCSQVWCRFPTSPHPSLSASHPQGQALSGARKVLWTYPTCTSDQTVAITCLFVSANWIPETAWVSLAFLFPAKNSL